MTEPNVDRNISRALSLDTATVSDALDRLGLAGLCKGIKPLDRRYRLAGRAFTVLYSPVGIPVGTVGDYIDDVPAGSVVVLDNGGRENATVWGDILTEIARHRNIAGTVIDGACRDIHFSLEMKYPIYSRSYSMRSGKGRVQVDGVNCPVNLGDVRVEAGSLLLGNADGVLVIPLAMENEVLSLAEQIVESENRIRALVRGGMRLDQARRQIGL
jgi:4-hydroxy-4-methyl-2-oxoglutarate aldolase